MWRPSAHMSEKPSEIRSGLNCPRCGRGLMPILSGSSVSFHCKNGHEVPLTEILTAQSAALRGGLDSLLKEWRRHHQAMISILADARERGYLDIAEIFSKHARSLESRISMLENAAYKTDSTKLIQVPKWAQAN